MHRLTTAFVLGYHGCGRGVGERLLKGEPFRASDNDYDWLGPGMYFWEANPQRALDFAHEAAQRTSVGVSDAFVVGAVIDLGLCLDLTTSIGITWARIAYATLREFMTASDIPLPENSADGLRRNLDCAVIRHLHTILEDEGLSPVDTIKGVFTEGKPVYPGAGFDEKTHVQIVVRNPLCIKGVFRVPREQLESVSTSHNSRGER